MKNIIRSLIVYLVWAICAKASITYTNNNDYAVSFWMQTTVEEQTEKTVTIWVDRWLTGVVYHGGSYECDVEEYDGSVEYQPTNVMPPTVYSTYEIVIVQPGETVDFSDYSTEEYTNDWSLVDMTTDHREDHSDYGGGSYWDYVVITNKETATYSYKDSYYLMVGVPVPYSP